MRAAQQIILITDFQYSIGTLDPVRQGLGGWTLGVQHTYDPIGQILYLGDGRRRSARAQSAIINTVAGTSVSGFSGDGGPATAARINLTTGGLPLNFTEGDVAVRPDGSIYIADSGNNRIRRVFLPLPEFSATDLLIAAEDGTEAYVFNGSGRHLRTLDTLTGATLFEFTYYDSEGNLTQVQDHFGTIATVERDTTGKPTAIVAVHGQRTVLATDANGLFSAITNPAGDIFEFEYTPGGLLTGMVDPRGNSFRFFYDDPGRLVLAEDPVGGSTTLARTETDRGFVITSTTGLGVVTTYLVEALTTGAVLMENIFPDGTRSTVEMGTDGSRESTFPDQTVTTLMLGPDPRFGMQAPIPQSLTIATAGGLRSTFAISRQAVLADPANPFSDKANRNSGCQRARLHEYL